jgi:DNA mismatch repair protein MSH5
VLIDEFGKGTNESGMFSIDHLGSKAVGLTYADGIGLACGVLEHLLNLEDPPKVIAATHFHEIFENNFLPLRPRLQLGHMEVKVCEESQLVEDQVTYLYKFVPPPNSVCLGANMKTIAFALTEAIRVMVLCTSRSLPPYTRM